MAFTKVLVSHPLLQALILIVLIAQGLKQLRDDICLLIGGGSVFGVGRWADVSFTHPILLLIALVAGFVALIETLAKLFEGERPARLLALGMVLVPQILTRYLWNEAELQQAPDSAFTFIFSLWVVYTFVIGPFAALLALLPADPVLDRAAIVPGKETSRPKKASRLVEVSTPTTAVVARNRDQYQLGRVSSRMLPLVA